MLLIIFLMMFAIVTMTQVNGECTCGNKTLHQHFCDDEFVVKVVILDHKLSDDSDNGRKYITYVLNNYKENNELMPWDYLELFTNSTNSTCGVTLMPSHHYILGEGKHWISLCNLVVVGRDIPCERNDYNNCDCKIIYEKCKTTKCPNENDSCIYNPKESEHLTDACLRNKITGKCQWKTCPAA
ncbi:metalloproteinase inhibitor 3-like [Mytilus galloprovincialis]|uniref:NTR domain-containing protein n=2 Tax=Mytilus galloprovincialis TaxID=29158 RepID=A0A8B6G526_MYTGA|nr:Hypothetical predicted protein [Mytilus galloprovincialis]